MDSTALTDDMELFLLAFSEQQSVPAALAECGIDKATLSEWRKECPAFTTRFRSMKAEVDRATDAARAEAMKTRIQNDPRVGQTAFVLTGLLGWSRGETARMMNVDAAILDSHLDHRMPDFQRWAGLPLAVACVEFRRQTATMAPAA